MSAETQSESALPQKVAGPGSAEVEMRLGPAARALAHIVTDGGNKGALAQALADIFPYATTIRLGVRTDSGLLLLSSCLLSDAGSPTTFFSVPDCPSALQESLDSGHCGFYLRCDAYKPDLHLLWRDAPHTMAALCGAVPSLGYLPEAEGCAAALLVGIRRGDNSLVSAGLTSLGRAFAQHLPAVLAHASKGADAYPPIPDPGSALHGLPPPSSSSHSPTSSSCLSSDNTDSWGWTSLSSFNARASRQFSASPQSTMRSGSSGRSSGSLGRQLPVCPEGVTIQEDLELWEPAGAAIKQTSGEAHLWAAEHGSNIGVAPSSAMDSSCSTLSSDNVGTVGRADADASSLIANSRGGSSEQLMGRDAEGSLSVGIDQSALSACQRSPAWDDDLQLESTCAAPSTDQPSSGAPAGFALFDSASSDPGAHSGPVSKGDALKTEQGLSQTVITADSSQQATQSVETIGMLSSSDGELGFPAMILEDESVTLSPQYAQLDDDTAGESDPANDAPGAAPARSGAPAQRARAARARARAQRARAAEAQQQQESTTRVSTRQRAVPERRAGGNGSDSDSALGGRTTPYRRRSPQHPFWLNFLDPVLEAAYVNWQAQQQFKGDVLSAILVIFVLLVELAHPSLEGSAFKLQASICAVAVGALYMIVMQRARWQHSRELLASCLHGVISGAILLFVFPAWARSLRGRKLRSLMWLFRFSGSEGSCAVPFIFMLRFRRALWNQAALLLASAAVSLPAVCGLPDAIKPPRLCFGLGTAMEAAAFVLPLVAVHLLERRARNNFLQSPAALLPHAG